MINVIESHVILNMKCKSLTFGSSTKRICSHSSYSSPRNGILYRIRNIKLRGSDKSSYLLKGKKLEVLYVRCM